MARLVQFFDRWGWMTFMLVSLIMLSTFYGLYHSKSIKFDDNKSLQSILPLWICVIIMIGFLLNTATTSYGESNHWFACLSSLTTLGLSGFALYSLK